MKHLDPLLLLRRPHRGHRQPLLALAWLALLTWLAPLAQAQQLLPPGPQTNGTVHTTYRQNGVQYVGGNFSQVGYPTGAATLLPGGTDIPSTAFPKVNGTVYCSAPDGSGGWFLGGSFNQVGSQSRSNLAHITAANVVDASFTTAANSTVQAMLLQGSTLYVGGSFTTLNGLSRNRLGALDAASGAVLAFDPNLDGTVNTLARNGTTLLAGGTFQRVGGSLCSNLAAFSLSTGARVAHIQADATVTSLTVDGSTTYAAGSFSGFGYNTGYSAQLSTTSDVPAATWPVINGTVNVTVPDGSGGWFVGGSFSQVGGVNRSNLVHITATNTVDTGFNPDPNSSITTLLLNGSTLYVGGNFTIIGGAVRNRLAGLSATTGLASSFDPNLDGAPNALARMGSTLYVGGGFANAQGTPARYLASYNLSTGLRTPYPGTTGVVQALLVDGSTLFVSGNFTGIGYYTGFSAQLSTSSDVPSTSWPVINGTVYATIGDGSGGWYVGGGFSQVGGISRSNLVHITASNAVDMSFNPSPNSTVQALLLSGGTLYVGGSFNQIGGQPRTYLGAVSATTGAATSQDLSTDGTVQALVQVGSTLYAGGGMTLTQGRPTRNLLAINITNGAVVPGLGTSSTIQTLLADGTTLYAGGSHTQVGLSVSNSFQLGTTSDVPSNTWPAINSTVYATISDGSGGWYVGGSFSLVGSLPRRNLAHILADNTVDPAFAPDPNSTVQALALQGSTLYVGGSFNQIGGQTRTNLAAVSASTGAALVAFDAAANSTVTNLAATASALYATGSFTSIGGQSRSQLAALNPTTGAATAWNPAPNSTVNELLVDGTGSTLYVGGSFTTIAGQSRTYLASFATATSTLNAFAPNPNSTVHALTLAGSTLYVGGSFNSIGGQSRQYLAGIDATTGLANSFNPRPNSTIVGLGTDGTTLFVSGSFTTVDNGTTPRNYLAAYTLSTSTVTAWNPSANTSANALVTDGSSVVVFNTGISLLKVVNNRGYLTALNTSTGQINTAFNAATNSTVQALALAGSTLYVGGSFSSIGGQNRSYLAGVDKTTGTATSFTPQPNSTVQTLITDGTTLYVGGNFTTVANGATPRNYLAAFALSTGAATSWNPNTNAAVQTLGLSGTTIVAGGSFQYLKGFTQNGLVALDAATGVVNPTFVANFNQYYYYAPQTMAVAGGTLYVGGNLVQYNGATVSNVLGLNKTTGALSGFAPTLNNTVQALVTDGTTLYAGGDFTQANSTARNRLAAFTLSTGALTSWNPNANGVVQTLGLSGTTLVAGGSFRYLNYQAKARLASLTSSGLVNTAFSPPSLSGATINDMLVTGGKLYIGGYLYYYTNSNGANQYFKSVTAFDKVTGFDDGSFTLDFQAGSGQTVNALSTDGTTLYVGGDFTAAGTTAPGTPRNRLAAFTLSTGALTSWNPSVNGTVQTLVRNGTDMLAGGSFTLSNMLVRQGLFAYSVRTGQVLPGFNANFYGGGVYALAAVGTKLYVGGSIYSYNGGAYTRGGLVAVNNLTGADLGFSAGLYGSNNNYASSVPVYALAASSTTLYVGGNFNSGYGSPRNYLAAYDLTTETLVSSFNPNPNNYVYTLLADGTTLYAGGEFTTIGGQTRNRLAAFSSNTLASWNPNANGAVRTLGINSTAVYAGGYFSNIGGQNRGYAAALDKTTAAATTWSPTLNNYVYNLLATDTRIGLAGEFTTANSQTAVRMAIFSPSANAPVFAAQLDSYGHTLTLSNDTLLVGGNFTNANGEPRSYLARFTLPATPTIVSFTPTSGPAGTVVTVNGSGFTGATGVTLNGTTVPTYTINSATQFTFTVPAGATTGLIAITTAAGTGSSTSPFTVVPAVAITSFSPASGKVGDGVTIYGNGFTGATAVRFNGVAAISPSVYNNTQIYATVPGGASTGPITVVAPGGTATSTTDFVVVPAPTVTSFSPTSGVAGDLVTITGTDFGGANTVRFNGTAASSFTVNSSTSISVTVPNGASTGPISVTALGGTGTSSASFTIVPVPVITSFYNYSGSVGTLISLYGYNFTGTTQVAFNGVVTSSFTVISATQVDVTVPLGATTGLIALTAPGGTATTNSTFTVTPSVTVSYAYGPGSSYNYAAIGNTVTVYGSGFSGATQVTFNGVAGTGLTVTNNTQLTVVVPVGASTGPLTVTTPAGSGTMSPNFTVIPPPTISSFTPSFGTIGSSVTIYGSGFDNGGTVTFGGGINSTYVYSYGPGYITFTVPTGASTGPLTVTTLGGTATSTTPFTVVGAPTITSFTPTSGLPGTTVTVSGTNLTGITQVYFNNTSTTFSNVTSTGFTTVVPAGATTGPIRVYTPAGTYVTTTNFVVPSLLPTISSFTPTGGPVNTYVTVTGTNFLTASGVTVGGVAVTNYTIGSATTLYLYVPAGAITGPIAITNPSGTATSSTNFTVVPAPVITTFSPTSGVVGISVTISGSNFQNASAVTFNNVAASGYVVNGAGTEITVNVPAAATTGLIRVTTPGGTANSGSSFTVQAPVPTITSFSPASGPVNTSVSIAGTNFTNASSVRFNGTAATFTLNSATSITATVPTGAITGLIQVTTPGGTAASPTNFVVLVAPVFTSFSPTSGGIGVSVILSGGNFQNTTSVQFNGINAPGFVVNGAGTQITVNVPVGASTGPILVTTPGGTATGPGNFTVLDAPTITSFTPTSGTPGTNVTVSGTNLTGLTSVFFNGVSASFSGVTTGSFTTQVPAGATTGPITLNTPGGTATSATNFVVNPAPVISSLAPATGPAGTSVVISGSGLGGTISVTFNGVAAFSFTINSASQITAIVPATASTGAVVVTNAGGTGTSPSSFTVVPTTLAAFGAVCANAANFTLTGGAPSGGTYSGTGVNSGQFSPATAGAGTHTITYTFTLNGVTTTATQPLTVNALPSVTLTTPASVCYQAAAFTLSGGSPSGGTYSGAGVSGGQFNATTAGVGPHTITYAYTNGAGCTASATSTITVLPQPTFTASATTTCPSQSVTLTVSNAGAGATYAWSPGGQTTASITVLPSATTAYSVTVTNAAGCTYTFNQTVTVSPFGTAPGVVSQLQPVDGSNGLSLPLTFSWSPASDATLYDLYIWSASASQPATPTVSGINALQYTYYGPLPYGAQYRWRIVARNPCLSTAGPVLAFGLRELPDVRVSFIQNPDTVYSGQTMQMSWNVTNYGTGSTLAQQWRDEVWLAQDSVFNAATAVRVGDWGNTTFLQPNATYITNATFRVPYSQAGYYYVFVVANYSRQLLETDYTNNRRRAVRRTLMIVPQTPDFSLENFVSPPDPSIGYTDVTMRYRVYNRGSVTATLPRYDEFFISPDTILNISQNTGRLSLGPNAISLGRRYVTDTLATNQFYARTVTVRVPHTEYGTRYFYVYSDTDNAIFETASTNNVNRPTAVQIILRPPADLTPIALTAPANALAGSPLAVNWDVRNIGNNPPVAEERYWSDQFWLSPTATFDPLTAIPIGALSVFSGDTLGVQHHYRRSVSLNIPNGTSGSYYVFGMADYVANSTRGNVFEYIYEGNNMRRSPNPVNITVGFADLEPTAFTGPTVVDAYQTFTVNYTVRNNSTAVGTATGPWTDAVYLTSPNGGGITGCYQIGQIVRSASLALGASYSGVITCNIPRYVPPGQYDIVVKTDAGNAVYEYNFENNNERRYGLTYRYSDDLRLTALSTTGTAYSGQTISVNFSVDNQGAFRTLATGWQDQFWLSPDATLDATDLQLTVVSRNSDLAVGASYNGSVVVRLPHGLQGNFYILGKAGVPDGRGYCGGVVSSVLNDTNPANNFRTTALPILLTPPCDLIPTSYTLPTDVVAGQQVTIPFTVRNQGVGATLEGNWDDGIYLNTSPSVNGSIRIGSYRHVGTLGAGASYSVSLPVTIPAYLSGNYYVFLVADNSLPSSYSPSQIWGGAVQYGTVYEHQQELNNVVMGSLLIRVPQPADLVVTSVTLPPARKLGQVMTIHYNVQNQGANNAVGQLKDGLYLSTDATVNGAVDQLFATKTANVTIAPSQTVPGVVRSRLQGLSPGSYHGLMATNLFNDIYEGPVSSPAANNNVTDAANRLAIGVDDLPLRTPTSFPLMLDSVVYYRVTPGADKDMVLTLTSNKTLGQNEMYVAYNRVPTPADYDYIYLNQVSTSQEILIPGGGAAPYYVLVKTPYVYPSLQTATLYADTLGFQVRSITTNRVGRGRVTTQVLGAGFRRLLTGAGGHPATRFFLTKGSDPTIRAVAQVLRFRNSTEVALRWHLDTLSVGLYNVVADNNGLRVQLTNGLTIEPSRPLNVDFATIIPQVVRVGTNANWTYFLQNNSNLDVPYWEFQYDLPPGQNPVITHTPNVRKKSDFYVGANSSTPRNRMDDGLTEVLPFVARDLRPGEIIQVNLRLTPSRIGPLPVVWNQAALTEEWYTRQTLDHIARYRAAVLAAPASYPAGVASLAANATAWTDSLKRYYVRVGLLDTLALRRNRLHTGYTALSDSIRIPGGVCGDWGVTECVRPFRPNPFDANAYPAALVGCADSIVFTYKGRGVSCTQIVGSADPNLIAGPTGEGHRKMVGSQQRLSYQVQFENDPELATAPAQVVRVTVPLSTKFDPQQFRLGSFGWADRTFQVPTNSSSYSAMLDMPDSLGYDVRVLGTVDVVGRRLIWQFETIDPATGVAPEDPNKGFLLLNDSTGRGQGFVNYTIKAAPSAVTGDTLAAQATIVFDTNPPLATNRWKNLLDAVAPASHLVALPPTTGGTVVNLSWTAQDDPNGSGLRAYDVYASQDGGPFQPVATNVPTTSYAFTGQSGSRYEFFTLASDTTANQEALKFVGDTYTEVGDTALVVYNLVQNQCLMSNPVTSTGAGTWQRLTLNGQTIAAINDMGHALGAVRVEFSVVSGPSVRQDGRGTKVLDRTWHLMAQNDFSGQPVQVRFYGLPAEFNKLQAADPTNVVNYNSLRLTQYSGANEDCNLANNVSATAQVRLLTPQTTLRDPAYFVAQATITDHFSEFYLHGGNRPLPVELTRFTAVRQGRDVRAAWATASERSSAYFAVEATDRPVDGFRELGRVAAAGSSSAPLSYSFVDKNVPTTGGVRYYRLRQVDVDGTFSYSPVQAVQLATETALTLAAVPNPFHEEQVQATIGSPEAAEGTLQLLDLAGRSLFSHALHLPAGSTTVALPELASLPPGVYLLTLRVGKELRQQKLLKQ